MSVVALRKLMIVLMKFAEEARTEMSIPSFQNKASPPLRPAGGTVNRLGKPKSRAFCCTLASSFLVSMRNKMSGEIVRDISFRRRTVRVLPIP